MKKFFAFCFVLSCANVSAQQVIPLYLDSVPFTKDTVMPTLTIYQPAQKQKGNNIAVIVCSGGSYEGRANSVEGIPAAEKLSAAGITAFLLDYRVPDSSKMYRKEIVPLTDAQRAIQYVRENAEKYKIDQKKIGIMGFSAGGHLVSTVVTHFSTTALNNPNNISVRPDFAVLVYPVISFADSLTHEGSRRNLIGPDFTPDEILEYSNERQVKRNTPPCFLVHAMDDETVKIGNSILFAAALKQQHIPVEDFYYAKGGHGFGVNNRMANVQWIQACIDWIDRVTTR